MDLNETTPLFVISVAAELCGMHPQTLRQYDRMGLVCPTRTLGKSRRYTMQDVAKLREIARLSQEGVSLEGIKRVLSLVDENLELRGVCRWRARSHQTQPRTASRAKRFGGAMEEALNAARESRAAVCSGAVWN